MTAALKISRRRQANEGRERLAVQLAERARQVGQIIAALPDGVALLFPDGRIGLANPVAQEILYDSGWCWDW